MPKKCPPGVICIENMTLLFIILFIFILGYFYYYNFLFKKNNTKKNIRRWQSNLNEGIQ